MNRELTQQVGLQINALYERYTALLLSPESYARECSTENVKRYLQFVDAALEKPYGRIHHIQRFLDYTDELAVDRMFPFCFLQDQVKSQLTNLARQTQWIMDGLQQFDDRAADSLRVEPHELAAKK